VSTSRATIRDVAAQAGVSVATVSKVINDRYGVSASTVERVRRVIAELGYESSLVARSLRNQRTNVIGILVSDIEPFSAELLKGAAKAVRGTGYEMVVYSAGGDAAESVGWESRYLSRLSGTLIDGAVLVTPTVLAPSFGAPVVAVDPHTGGEDVPTVDSDNRRGAEQATEHLLELGHRRIGFLAGRADLESARLREEGFRAAIAAAGLPLEPALVLAGDYDEAVSAAAAHRLLTLPEPPTAIFAANDLSAIATIDTALTLGIRVPADLSVVGFDNVPESTMTRPMLTTVEQPIQLMGQRAIELLVQILDGVDPEPSRVRLPTRLVVRDSTAIAGGGRRAVATAAPIGSIAWRDADRDPGERAAALVAAMTPAEKLGQLIGVWVGAEASGGVAPHQDGMTTDPVDLDALLPHGIGQLTRPFGTAPVDPAAGAAAVAAAQRRIAGANRFGIPAVVHEECLTGLAAWQATVFPAPLCWGASFDPELVARMAAGIGATMRGLGVHQGLAPVLDVARDPRWGRVEETIGEDPLLVGAVGAAYVRGLQSAGVVATLKHFVGYSAGVGGRNMAPVSVGRRELADVLLPPFEMALRAGARSVMNAYSAVDGVPAAADEQLLTDLLRDRLGFTGTVVSDYFAVAFLQRLHAVAADRGEAAGLALRAGIDVELPTVDCFGEPLRDAVEHGRVDAELVDRALTRVLRQKVELGLLDPGWDPEPAGPFELDAAGTRAVAAELAERAIVLLANDGTLPLRPDARVALVGPRAADPTAMMGCYSFPVHVGGQHPDVPLGIEVATLLDALRAEHGEVSFAEGCPVLGGDDAGIAAAVEQAAAADVCVLALGDRAGMFGAGTSGEGCDAVDLRLPGRQEELLEAVLATGTPVVLVLLCGRPYDLSRQVDRLAAVVCGFYPGEEGGPALAGVLTGRVDPAGRLPIAFSAGIVAPGGPAQALAGRSEVSAVDPTPLFPFGHGLTYTPVSWADAEIDGPEWRTDGRLWLSVALHNPHDRPASEVVQVYLHRPVAEVALPVQRLVAFARVDLAPGQRRTVSFDLSADLTSYTGRDRDAVVTPGPAQLRVAASAADVRSVLDVRLVGPRRAVGADRELTAGVQLAD
jgi:beta-xylosidase